MSTSKKTKKKISASKLSRSAVAESLDDQNAREAAKIETKRKRLLARVAAHIASGIMTAPSSSATSKLPEGVGLPDFIAEASVDIAEAILKRVGL